MRTSVRLEQHRRETRPNLSRGCEARLLRSPKKESRHALRYRLSPRDFAAREWCCSRTGGIEDVHREPCLLHSVGQEARLDPPAVRRGLRSLHEERRMADYRSLRPERSERGAALGDHLKRNWKTDEAPIAMLIATAIRTCLSSGFKLTLPVATLAPQGRAAAVPADPQRTLGGRAAYACS
jgi:hypothetical protein